MAMLPVQNIEVSEEEEQRVMVIFNIIVRVTVLPEAIAEYIAKETLILEQVMYWWIPVQMKLDLTGSLLGRIFETLEENENTITLKKRRQYNYHSDLYDALSTEFDSICEVIECEGNFEIEEQREIVEIKVEQLHEQVETLEMTCEDFYN